MEEDGSESSEYFSPEDNRSWDAHSRRSPEAQHRHAHAHAAVAQQQRDEEWGHGQLYQPPVVTFDASALEAAAAAEAGPRGGDAGAASAAAGLPPLHPGAAIAAAEGGRRFEHKGSGGSSNTSRSFGSAQRFSIASSGEAAAAAAAAAALAAVEEEQAGEGERPQTGLWRAADAVQQPIMVLLQVGGAGAARRGAAGRHGCLCGPAQHAGHAQRSAPHPSCRRLGPLFPCPAVHCAPG